LRLAEVSARLPFWFEPPPSYIEGQWYYHMGMMMSCRLPHNQLAQQAGNQEHASFRNLFDMSENPSAVAGQPLIPMRGGNSPQLRACEAQMDTAEEDGPEATEVLSKVTCRLIMQFS
jgi:hypothetical protein